MFKLYTIATVSTVILLSLIAVLNWYEVVV